MPRDQRAAEGIDYYFQDYNEPTVGYVEQCYFIELAEDTHGQTLVLLRNAAGDQGISLHFECEQLPCFTLWKNTADEADGYVTGLEPATNYPNLKTFEREQGRVISLSPEQTYLARLTLAVHDSSDAVSEVERQVDQIQLIAGVPNLQF